MKRRISFLTFISFFLLFTTSCSVLVKNGSSSVSLKIDEKTAAKITGESSSVRAADDDVNSKKFFLDISLKGEYTAKQTLIVISGAEVTFNEVPAGVKIYAEANAYQLENDEKTILYTGKSDEITIIEGENTISIIMEKFEEPSDELFTFYVSSTGTEAGDGSAAAPLNSIEAAVMLMTDQSRDYTILIDGEITGAQYIFDSLSSDGSIQAKSITLEGKTGNSKDKLNGGFTDASNDGTTLSINTVVPVTIKNLTITGGFANTYYGGGGIYIDGESDVTLEDGSLITGNSSVMAAAGILVYDCSTLTMHGGSIEENTSNGYNTEGNFSGAGVLVYGNADTQSATFIMTGGNISKNTAIGYGGGVGIVCGTFVMSGGTIGGTTEAEGNIVGTSESTYGGGVWLGSNSGFNMSGGLISNNKALGEGATLPTGGVSKCGGGGVYVISGSTFAMTGTEATISNNYSACCGGGVYISGSTDSGGTFSMEHGSINENIAADNGNGVYLTTNESKFILAGSGTDIAESDDIYLPANGYVTVEDTLMGGVTITLTPENYSEGRKVLEATEVDLSIEYTTFVVTPQTDPTGGDTPIDWYVSDTGLLTRTPPTTS